MCKLRNVMILSLILIASAACSPLPATVTASPVAALPTLTDVPPVPAGLNPTGPYILYTGAAGTWLSNPDGSFLTRLADLGLEEGGLDFSRLISPQGDRLALIVSNDKGIDLMEVRIPGGETKTIAHLIDITRAEFNSDPRSEKAIAAHVIDSNDNLAWQPGEGRFLAFVGALNGPTSDLYVYDTQSGKIIQLSDGPLQALSPSWSPDGKYILYTEDDGQSTSDSEVVSPDEHVDGVWAVRVADRETITQPTPKGIAFLLLGWQDDRHYITYESNYGTGKRCSFENLRSVDVVSAETVPITDLEIKDYIAYSPENGAILFTGTPACEGSAGKGTFLLLPGQTQPAKLLEEEASEVLWMPESRVFFVYPQGLFSPDGKTRYDPPVPGNSFQPALSQKGYQAWEVILNGQSYLEIKAPEANWQQIAVEGPVDQMLWDPASGEMLLMIISGKLYAAAYPDFKLRTLGEVSGVEYAVWVP